MARSIKVQVGPLAAASTNNIATSQNPGVTSYLALNGTLGSATANNVALSQSVSGASLVLINGALSQTIPATGTTVTGALLPAMQNIYITSAGNDSGITFAIVGLDNNNAAVTETLTGANTAVAVSLLAYRSIISIKTSGSTASTITVGTFGAATLDTPRHVLITTSSTTAFLISGTDWYGDPISETVTNAGSSVQSVLSYATVTSIKATSPTAAITVGTNGVANSPPVLLDEYGFPNTMVQCDVTGTVNYTLESTVDALFGISAPARPDLVTWFSSQSPIVASTVSAQGMMVSPALIWRITLNSETAGTGNFVTASFTQYGNVPL